MSFEVREGEVVAILGPNGAGKSSLYNTITMIVKRSDGDIKLIEEEIERFDAGKNGHLFGLVCQSNVLWDNFTVDEHLNIICDIKGFPRHKRESHCENLKQLLNLDKFSKIQSRFLSGGNKRKLCIAMAMTTDSPYLIFDEPSAGLDPVSRKRMFSYFKSHENK